MLYLRMAYVGHTRDLDDFRAISELDRTRGAVRPLGGYLGRGLKNHKNHQKVRKKRVPENASILA